MNHYIFMYPNDADDVFYHFLSDKSHSKRHFHPLIDGLYQRHTSEKCAKGMNPLIDYIQFRSHFNFDDKMRSAISTPNPKNVLPSFSSNYNSFFKEEPLVSIITPCYKSNSDYLEQCVNSVISQSYLNWELVLIDDGSPNKETWDLLVKQSKKDSRIKLIKLKINSGISLASNAGINCSKGSYLAFLDHDDVLAPDALYYCLSELISKNGDAIYSDQAYITASGDIDQTFFKPDWSPTLFTGAMYIGHFLVVRKDIALKCGLFNKRFDGCQDYEFMLRYSELTTSILHLPKILYYWRRAEGSIAANANAKGHIEKKQLIAVSEHFQRLNINSLSKIDIKVPHRLNIRPIISSKRHATDILVDSKVPRDILNNFLANTESFNIKIKNIFSYKSNSILDFNSLSGFLLFINPFIIFEENDWFEYLRMYSERSKVCFSSTHVFDENSNVISAGFIASDKIGYSPAYFGYKNGDDGNAGTLLCDREVSIVGSDCTLVSYDDLKAIGGLNSSFLTLDGAVKDASYRATLENYRNITCSSKLFFKKSLYLKKSINSIADAIAFIDIHKKSLASGDRYYNKNFTSTHYDFK